MMMVQKKLKTLLLFRHSLFINIFSFAILFSNINASTPLKGLKNILNIEGSYTLDISTNLSGGVRQDTSIRGLLDVGFNFDLAENLQFDNGTFFVDFQIFSGDNGNNDTGDFQTFSNIDNNEFEILSELWFEKFFFDDFLRIKIGKADVNSDFAYTDHGVEFINSSMGYSPTIFVFPTYPDPAMSINFSIYPQKNRYLSFGVYDGSTQLGKKTGTHGLDSFFEKPTDYFYIAEIGAMWQNNNNKLAGRIGFGSWYHTAQFVEFNKTISNGTYGFYLVVDQNLWLQKVGKTYRTLDAFFQYGYADKEVSQVEHHIGAGIVLNGLIAGRFEDKLGIGITSVQFSDEPGSGSNESSELAGELFYKFKFNSNLILKPDLQYIKNPSGNVALDDAVVTTIRAEFLF